MELVTNNNAKKFEAQAFIASFPEAALKLNEIKTIHHFSYGVYAREIHIPEDTYLVGELHKFENLNILSEGEISVLMDDGWRVLKAPFHIVSPAGTKRAAYTHTNCVWTTIHGTNLKDISAIKNYFIAASEKEWLEFSGANQLELSLCS